MNRIFSFSIDGDIDDEEFFDNQLEAYFDQLVQREMARRNIDARKLSECCTVRKLSENGLCQVGLKSSSKLSTSSVP